MSSKQSTTNTKVRQEIDGSVHIMTGTPRGFMPDLGYTNKTVTNDFFIENSTVKQMAANNQGPVTMERKEEVFEAGARNTDFTMTDGTVIQPTIGGKSTYKNQNTDISVGQSVGGGGGDWSYDVQGSILTILKKGVPTNLLYEALVKGKKIKELAEMVAKMNPEKQDVAMVFQSMLQYMDEKMDTT